MTSNCQMVKSANLLNNEYLAQKLEQQSCDKQLLCEQWQKNIRGVSLTQTLAVNLKSNQQTTRQIIN